MTNQTRRAVLAAAAVLLSLALIFGVWSALRKPKPVDGPDQTPIATPAASASTDATPTATGTSDPADETTALPSTPGQTPSLDSVAPANASDLVGCAPAGTEIVATRFEVPARKISQPVIQVGTEADGAVGSPPLEQKFTVGVWTEGPKVGSKKGHVISTIHTWTGDVALGNVLNASNSGGLHPGDVIRLTDGKNTVCYTYREKTYFRVSDYDPTSRIWINPSGKPQLTIMICWDFNKNTEDWDSRILFYADLVSA